MKALLQRVAEAGVTVDGRIAGEIKHGLLVFVCAVKGDGDPDIAHLAKKISQLRIFEDGDGKMNRSVLDINGELLVVSQFTLAASTRKGNRPSFDDAEAPERARQLYDRFLERLRGTGLRVQTGVFAASMAVTLVNDGPVTILLDSKER